MPLIPIALVVGALIGITIQKTVDEFKNIQRDKTLKENQNDN